MALAFAGIVTPWKGITDSTAELTAAMASAMEGHVEALAAVERLLDQRRDLEDHRHTVDIRQDDVEGAPRERALDARLNVHQQFGSDQFAWELQKLSRNLSRPFTPSPSRTRTPSRLAVSHRPVGVSASLSQWRRANQPTP